MIEVLDIDMPIPPEATAKLNKKAIRGLVRDLASGARARWIQLAKGLKSSFRGDYIRGIQQVKFQGDVAVISLVGEIPHMLEDGSPQVDMRDFLLGEKVPVVPRGERGKHENKAGGYYRAIPFRHAIPSAGQVVGQAMGSAYSGHEAVRDAKRLGREVYKSAKALDATTSNPYGKTTYGSRLDTEKLRTWGTVIGPQQRMVPLLRPHHKTDIYQGMIREEKVYKEKAQSQYMTFRTISTTGGDPDSWIRKKIEAVHLADQVAEFVQKHAPMSLKAFLEAEE